MFNGGTVVIEGNGYTVTGLPGMLFDKQGSGGHHLRMSDITFDGAKVAGGDYAAVIVGYADSMSELYFEDVTIKNSTVTGSNYAAAFVGYAAGYNVQNDGPVYQQVTFKNCTVENNTIIGGGSTGALMGHAAGNSNAVINVEDTTVTGNTITCTGSSTNKAGSLFGTVGAAGSDSTADTPKGLFVSATVSDNTVTSGGTAITTICGRQGTATARMVLTEGGSYDACPFNESDTWASVAEGVELTANNGSWTAVNKLEEAKTAAKAAIDAAVDGDTSENVAAAAASAKTAIDAAADTDAVNTAKENGLAAIQSAKDKNSKSNPTDPTGPSSPNAGNETVTISAGNINTDGTTNTIDVASSGTTSVTAPKDVLDDVVKADATKPVEFNLKNTSVEFNTAAVKAISGKMKDLANTDNITLVVLPDANVTGAEVTAKNTVAANNDNAKVIKLELKAADGTNLFEAAAGAKATVTVPFTMPAGCNRVNVYYLNPTNGKAEPMGAATIANGTATFSVPHFSNYVLVPTYVGSSPASSTAAKSAASPKTADAGIAMYGVLSIMSLMGMGYIGKKKSR